MGSKEDSIHSLLLENYPDVSYYLNFSTPIELVVAALLSPQVKDEKVNAATPDLFARYTTAQEYAEADFEELLSYVKSISFCATKVKRIQGACKVLHEDFNGEVPDDVDKLVKLPGIGRKTANAIVINAFGKISGIPTDSHVLRVAYRMGLADSKDAYDVEKSLMGHYAKDDWKKLPWMIKQHGRDLCKPTPICSKCFIKEHCSQQGVTKQK